MCELGCFHLGAISAVAAGKRSIVFQIRSTPGEAEVMKALAERRGWTVAAMLRDLVRRELMRLQEKGLIDPDLTLYETQGKAQMVLDPAVAEEILKLKQELSLMKDEKELIRIRQANAEDLGED